METRGVCSSGKGETRGKGRSRGHRCQEMEGRGVSQESGDKSVATPLRERRVLRRVNSGPSLLIVDFLSKKKGTPDHPEIETRRPPTPFCYCEVRNSRDFSNPV